MPRKGHVPRKEVLPDPVYHDIRVAKLVNNVMLDGKKVLAQRIVYGAFDTIQERIITVSYTHLDVYKRQMPSRPNICTLIACFAIVSLPNLSIRRPPITEAIEAPIRTMASTSA